MRALTERQKVVLDYLEHYIAERRYPPTVREIAENFSITAKGAYDHLKALEKKGVIKLGENRSRSMEILGPPPKQDVSIEVPILGSVAAGRPILAEENMEGTVSVPPSMAKEGQCFALRVRGDSMIGVGIFDGDLAIIEQRQTAENGEIVVALMEDSVTLKRFFKEKGRVRLAAENPAYAPIFTQDVKILGKLRGLLRTY